MAGPESSTRIARTILLHRQVGRMPEAKDLGPSQPDREVVEDVHVGHAGRLLGPRPQQRLLAGPGPEALVQTQLGGVRCRSSKPPAKRAALR